MREPPPEPAYRLRLFISGATPRSSEALTNIKAFGEKHLSGRYELEVVDAYQQAHLVNEDQIVALPTLVRHLPLPIRRLIGDMSDEDRVMIGLDIVAAEEVDETRS